MREAKRWPGERNAGRSLDAGKSQSVTVLCREHKRQQHKQWRKFSSTRFRHSCDEDSAVATERRSRARWHRPRCFCSNSTNASVIASNNSSKALSRMIGKVAAAFSDLLPGPRFSNASCSVRVCFFPQPSNMPFDISDCEDGRLYLSHNLLTCYPCRSARDGWLSAVLDALRLVRGQPRSLVLPARKAQAKRITRLTTRFTQDLGRVQLGAKLHYHLLDAQDLQQVSRLG